MHSVFGECRGDRPGGLDARYHGRLHAGRRGLIGSHRRDAISIPGQSMWDLWWTEWHRDRFLFMYYFLLLSLSFHMCHILIFMLLLSEGQAADVSKMPNQTAFFRKSGAFGRKVRCRFHLWLREQKQRFLIASASTSLLLRSNVLHVRKDRDRDPHCAVSLTRT